jgi:hypothetical protein
LEFQIVDPLIVGRQLDGMTSFTEMLSVEAGQQTFALLQKVC